ncbi:MAG TPA: hypothetical protein VN642_04135, partial [Dongiaceae bacterium]|nr:hypothetical protein [Dongiaceae bacterium]
FGHTGYSGSSIWMDPKQDLFVVLLTNRLNYRDTRMFNQLRRDVSDIAVAEFGLPADSMGLTAVMAIARITADLMRPPPPPTKPTLSNTKHAKVSSIRHIASRQKFGRKSGKNHRRKPHGRKHLA